MLCLPLKYINGWLFGIDANRVKEALKAKIIQYQRDIYDLIADAFGVTESGIAPTVSADVASPRVASLVQIRDVSLAVAQMAQDNDPARTATYGS
jgi:hypothetical protein